MAIRKQIPLALAAILGFGLISSINAFADPPPVPLGGCGNGHILLNNPTLESFLASSNQNTVNFDGYVCVNTEPNEHGRGFIIITDNNRQGPPQ